MMLFHRKSELGLKVRCIQVNNYEIVINFFHISHNLTWYSAIVHKFTRIYPVWSTYEPTKQFICVKNCAIDLKTNNLYTQNRNICPGWPVYEVKCLCSRGREWERELCSTPTSNSIFDSYDMETLWFKFGHGIFNGFKMSRL
jgi:hypothetical protein